jgi:hypothetical protein
MKLSIILRVLIAAAGIALAVRALVMQSAGFH